MATRKGKSHDLGTPAGRSVRHPVGKGRAGRQAVSGSSGRSADRDRRGPAVTAARYSMLIQWSDEDAVFVVTLPEFGDAHTHGDTYEKAAKQGRLLIESF